ncbi:MAG TPA: DUF934 domain-containing protein [Casimicrobiaceae bacterium]
MPLLIKDRAIVEDRWTLLRDATSLADVPGETPVIVPLALWKSQHEALAARKDVGVWLKPDADPDMLAADIDSLPLIAIDFPKFVDGRGYSTARLLRDKYRFGGELRAIGDVMRDQLYYLQQCGFDAFAVRADRNVADAIGGLDDFSDNYQSTVARPVPLFRRRINTTRQGSSF